jgi:glycosyltransferase involved in cell wall biosynthesis
LSTPVRIILVGDYPEDERLGSPKALLRLRDELRAQGHTATTILRPQIGESPRQRHLRDLLSPWLSSRAVRDVASRDGVPDVVDASSAEGLLLGSSRVPWARTAVVVRSHGLEHLNYARMLDDARHGLVRRGLHRRIWYPAVRMRAVAAAAKHADGVILLNEMDRRFVLDRGWAPPDRIDVIPHGLAAAFLEPVPQQPRGSGFLFCGSWDRVKGIDYLARAFDYVVSARPAARLTILGPGVPAERVRAFFDANVRSHLDVLDRADESEVLRQYRRHDAIVMCSTYEGFGMVVPEAMSQRLPVVATPVGSAASLVRDGRTGLLVPPRDEKALAAAMIRMYDDSALRDRLAAAAIELVRSMSWAATATATVAAYHRALARRTGSGVTSAKRV